MADFKLLSNEKQTELVENAKSRMDSIAVAWLQNPKLKAAVLKPAESCEERKIS